ncbi:MAG: excinuclease ABC subunit UvrA [Methanobacteriota archaeon]
MQTDTKMKDAIRIRGAREHNLKNVDVTLPRDELIVITGLSGSGKSSLAFDTIYAEGQRRYVESLSSYARQFLGQMEKPDVDAIDGLSPAISIDQKRTSHNPRSTVGTVTEIHDYLRVLFANAGVPHCPQCGKEVARQSPQEIVDRILARAPGTRFQLVAPIVRDRKGEYKKLFKDLAAQGYQRVRVNGKVGSVDDDWPIARYEKHTIEVVLDRLTVEPSVRARLTESVEAALKMTGGIVTCALEGEDLVFSDKLACTACGISLPDLAPRSFSFNSPHGACPACLGLGTAMEVDAELLVENPGAPVREAFRGDIVRYWTWFFKELEQVGRHYGFKLSTAWEDLSDRARAIVLRGSGEKFKQTYRSSRAHSSFFWEGYSEYEGLATRLERIFRETENEKLRERLAELMSTKPCKTCGGRRLKPEILAVTVGERSIHDVSEMPIDQVAAWFEDLPKHLTDRQRAIAKDVLKEIRARLRFMLDVGLEYLTLSRSANTLSGGEAQRIRLATQIGSGLVGVLYILDEPSIGLHQRDNERLIQSLQGLRDLGNTLLVVEHDEGMIRAADHVVDLGPGAGEHGGRVVAQGTPGEIERNPKSLTGRFLSGKESIPLPARRREGNGKSLTVVGASENNLKSIDLRVPLGLFVCVTGVSGSGKSTFVNEILYRGVAKALRQAHGVPGAHQKIHGVEHVDKVIIIDQSPIGRTPRSNPATYTGCFAPIRDLFAAVPDARARGYTAGRFSFNVRGGRCEACQGDGVTRIEMHFLADVYVPCEVCKGARYNRETLEIRYKGKSIRDVLDMTVSEALAFFGSVPRVQRVLQTLDDVGLGYIRLGQQAPTLSGGEAQRVKLATELCKRATGKTVYILDEPTTGLHFADIRKLLGVLNRLVDAGNTIVVIEHNLDVVKTADWILDLGPEGGEKGGRLVAEGPPEAIAKAGTYTGRFLEKALKAA